MSKSLSGVVVAATLVGIALIFLAFALLRGDDIPKHVTDRYERSLYAEGIPECTMRGSVLKMKKGDLVRRVTDEEAGKIFEYLVANRKAQISVEPLLGVVFTIRASNNVPVFIVVAGAHKDYCVLTAISSYSIEPFVELTKKYSPPGWVPSQ